MELADNAASTPSATQFQAQVLGYLTSIASQMADVRTEVAVVSTVSAGLEKQYAAIVEHLARLNSKVADHELRIGMTGLECTNRRIRLEKLETQAETSANDLIASKASRKTFLWMVGSCIGGLSGIVALVKVILDSIGHK